MSISAYAGKPAEPWMLTNIPRLVTAYYVNRPDPAVPAQRVAFGTSGHRGSSLDHAFNEAHILAITQAICLYRKQQGIDGPLFLGIDTHGLSEPAFASALEVLAANGVEVMVDAAEGYTPTPVISHAILTYNRGRQPGPGRWHRHHAFPQSPEIWRLQIQSAPRRPGGHRRDSMDRTASQRLPHRWTEGGGENPL